MKNILSTLKGGTVLVFTRTTTDNRGVIWFRVNCDGQTGWVSGKYAKINK